ncbi:hypothetical protein PQR63_23370 [Herbaspirillum rhizosphaerae]|uniref:Integrase n=1 Tax=Herbaspirillum rhizosphaerae TaxID=346179 RepID=A0ABW8ZEQ4_9BURK
MADLSKKRGIGHGLHPFPTSSTSEKTNKLQFWTTHNRMPCFVDLTELSTGVSEDEIQRDSYRWKGREGTAFFGRPKLIGELAPYFYARYRASPKEVIRTNIARLRWWWRLFDRFEGSEPVRSIEDLNELHYAAYRTNPCGSSGASFFFTLVAEARADSNLPPLYWTAIRIPPKERELPLLDDVKRLYHWLKRPAFEALRRYEHDPDAIPTKHEVVYLFAIFILNTGWNPQVAVDIDVDTCDKDGAPLSIIPHPQSDAHSIVLSKKARARNSIQSAISNNGRQLSPHNILLSLIRQTTPLRNRLKQKREELARNIASISPLTNSERDTLNAAISGITAFINSPWIYEILASPKGTFGTSAGKTNTFLPEIGRLQQAANIKISNTNAKSRTGPVFQYAAQCINSKLSETETKVSENISLTDLRDAFISWRYEKSGYSWMDAMLAAGHGNIESLRAYLRKKQHRAFSQKEFSRVTGHMWDAITAQDSPHNREDLTLVIAAKVAGASAEQIARWQAGKDRTYVGAGCINISSPPRHISPNHTDGTLCRIQRCTLCPENAILFHDSHVHLAKRIAELRYLQCNMSITSWLASDYPIEMEKTWEALAAYDSDQVSRYVKEWELAIAEKRHFPLIMDGAYE